MHPRFGWALICLGCVLIVGCQGNGNNLPARIQANLAKLSPADRRLAEQQKFCAVETENELGSMGVPVKILIKDQPVFLCCKGCRKTAEDEPDKTLAKAKKLREANAAPAHSGS
ncbi:MAG TPA: hypothetical protein VFA18_24695 [Gemmataceae bacterium]|nr:hypothetical protein [Gemmataceae bacterium]